MTSTLGPDSDMFDTLITIGNFPDSATQNAACKRNVIKSGLYACDSPTTGNYIFAYRDNASIYANYGCTELRAYEGLPLTLTFNMLSDGSGTENLSLYKSLVFDEGLPPQNDDYGYSFLGFFKVTFGSEKNIKAVVVWCNAPDFYVTFGS